MRVVIDPNVLLSALIAPGGASDRAVRGVVAHGTPVVSTSYSTVSCNVRVRNDFGDSSASPTLKSSLVKLGDLADVAEDSADVPAVVVDDPSDDYLVALSRDSRAECLLTGDQGIHRALETADDLRVVSPAD